MLATCANILSPISAARQAWPRRGPLATSAEFTLASPQTGLAANPSGAAQ